MVEKKLAICIGFILTSLYDVSSLICGRNDETMISIAKELQNMGYYVEKGFVEWRLDIPNYGTQPGMAYGIYNFERLNNDLLDDGYYNYSNNTVNNIINNTLGYYIRHHQSPDNFWFQYGTAGILINWCLPPTYYYSYGTYVNRVYNPDTTINFTRKHYLPETDPYGSLTDMINNANMKYYYKGNSYYNTSFIISTGDNKTYTDIYNVINRYHDQNIYQDINLQEMPYQYSKFKERNWIEQILNGEVLDSFDIVLRAYGLSVDDTYWNVNQTVFKIYPLNNRTKIPREPYMDYIETYNPQQKNIIYNEQENLQQYFDLYLKAINNYFMFGDKSFGYMYSVPSTPYYKNGYNYGYGCINYGTRCLGDNRDAQYFFQYPNAVSLPNNTIQFIIGLHHELLNVCQFGNFVPYFEIKNIVQYVTKKYYRSNELYLDYNMMNGSSNIFPPKYWINNTIPDNILDKIWIAVILRPNMVDIFNYSNIIPTLIVDEHKLPLKNKWFPMERCYLNSITKTRPPPYTMISNILQEYIHVYWK